MNLTPIFLTISGVLLLISSLFPTQKLCRHDHHGTKSWKILGILILLFILGYLAFAMILIQTPSLDQELSLIVSLILFGGGIFVSLVTRNAQLSIEHIISMVAEERHRALHDELTELPNRKFLNSLVDRQINGDSQATGHFAVLLIDLNSFKEINDALGHFYGDYLLQKVSTRLGGSIEEGQTLARWGGDKFSILLPGAELEAGIAASHRVKEVMAHPFKIEGRSISVGTSVGVAVFPEHGKDTETILRHADIAMYEAKRNQVDYAVFNPDEDRTTWNRLIMLGELREAIENNQLVLHYQPQISVLDGSLSGLEALVRWQHHEQGLVYPGFFIELIEQAGLCKDLTSWVLDNALGQLHKWREQGFITKISVNLSIKNLHDYEFAGEVAGLLEKWGIKAGNVTLEITESSIMVDPGRVTKVVADLMRTGINLSIDDFGTGYSSLSYLRKFPASEIKIDKSFVTEMLDNHESAMIVKSTIDMAHNIGRQIVAEGVENDDTRVLLKRLGCDSIQGFHISPPLPADHLIEWNRQQSSKTAQAPPSA